MSSKITASFEGRDMHLRIAALDPYIIRPLPGYAGEQMTKTYLETATNRATPEQMTDALAMALDGAVLDPDTNRWVPLPAEDRLNADRMGYELSIGETEDVAMVAMFWQTILGEAAVRLYLGAGGGVEGHTKALRALITRMGLSPSLTSPSSALDDLTLLASTPSTSSRPDGEKPGKQPRDRQPKTRIATSARSTP